MNKPLFNWGEQYDLQREKYFSRLKKQGKTTRTLRKEYTRKLRRKLKKIKIEEME